MRLKAWGGYLSIFLLKQLTQNPDLVYWDYFVILAHDPRSRPIVVLTPKMPWSLKFWSQMERFYNSGKSNLFFLVPGYRTRYFYFQCFKSFQILAAQKKKGPCIPLKFCVINNKKELQLKFIVYQYNIPCIDILNGFQVNYHMDTEVSIIRFGGQAVGFNTGEVLVWWILVYDIGQDEFLPYFMATYAVTGASPLFMMMKRW